MNALWKVTALRPDGWREVHYYTCCSESEALERHAARGRHAPDEVAIAAPVPHRLIVAPWTELPAADVPRCAEEPVARPLLVRSCAGACNQGRESCDCGADLDTMPTWLLLKWLAVSVVLVGGAYAAACALAAQWGM